jgi:YD repeat-containing protein
MTYDGHGRMKTRHYPVEDAGTNTTWSYNADDTIQMVIDPRGAITNFSYEAQRGLLTNISYQVPTGSTIPVTPSVSFGYDALGNRTSMDTNGISNITYSYDSLSRMTSETVDFDDLTENFTIGYSYHLGGALKSITDPNNSTVNYTNDKTGRLTAVTGTAWGENTTGNYASGITYRAFGKLKQINYTLPDESPQIKMDYDSRLRISHSEVVTNKMTSGYLMKADFAYSADSRL